MSTRAARKVVEPVLYEQKREVNLLIVDDEKPFVTVLEDELRGEGFRVSTACNGVEGLKKLEEKMFDVCILDLNMPGLNGMEVLKKASDQALPTEFIMLTAHASVQTASESIRLGAYDYITKPCDLARITMLIRRAYEKRVMKQESLILKRIRSGYGKFITRNRSLLSLLEEAKKVARTDASVLIQGESGTGKELMAEFIHANSCRANGPFLAFNSTAIQESLLESELFGYEKGAFTGATGSKEGLFELANGGTIFLDEIGDLPMQTQVKLLRVLELGTFYKAGGTREFFSDVRVITATNKDLQKAVEDGTFREDLYYRLSGITFTMISLRDRKEDIAPLAEGFLNSLPVGYKKGIDEAAMEILMQYDWPGNIRELQNVLNRVAILSDSETIGPGDLPMEMVSPRTARDGGKSLATLDEVEREHIINVLDQTGCHKKKAADILGIDVKTLYRKIKKYNLAV